MATSQAGLTVGQKCFRTKSREEEQTHSLCPQGAGRRSCPHRDPQLKSQFVLPQQPGALSSDKTQKDVWQLQVGVDGSLDPCGLWGLTEELRHKQGPGLVMGQREDLLLHRSSQDLWASHSNFKPYLTTCEVEAIIEPPSQL